MRQEFPEDKIEALNKAGIPVAASPTELPELMKEKLAKAKKGAKSKKKATAKTAKKATGRAKAKPAAKKARPKRKK